MRQKSLLLTLIGIALILLSGCGQNVATPEQAKTKSKLPPVQSGMAFATGQQLPSFTLNDLKGNKLSQNIFAGSRLTVLNLWATF
ncbi:MAG: TlpA family protein disulfide reductase [Bacillota bacterium]